MPWRLTTISLRPHFLDNMAALAIECCLLKDLDGIFTPTAVLRLERSALNYLTKESPKDAQMRSKVSRSLQTLLAAQKTCQRYAIRQTGAESNYVRRTSYAADGQSRNTPKRAQVPMFYFSGFDVSDGGLTSGTSTQKVALTKTPTKEHQRTSLSSQHSDKERFA